MSDTRQPEWKLVAQLGDAHPLDHGGYFVYEDTTGVYDPEAEWLIAPEEDDSGEPWVCYRFILEPCTFTNGILSDNQFHPDKPAWFSRHGRIESACACSGIEAAEFIRMITTGTTVERAMAWRLIGEHYGFDNLDAYPLQYENRHSVEEAYPRETWRVCPHCGSGTHPPGCCAQDGHGG